MDHKTTIKELKRIIGLEKPHGNTETTYTTTTSQTSQNKRVGGFANKHHDIDTKQRISASQKARYALIRQQIGQRQQQEQSQVFGPIIDLDSPKFIQRVKDIVKELLSEEIQKAIPKTRQNIPIF